MKHLTSFAAVALAAFAMTSCVSKKQFTELKSDYDNLQNRHAALQNDYNDAKVSIAKYSSTAKSLEERLAEEQKRNAEMKAAYAQLQGSYQNNVQQGNVNISKLVDEINASNKFIKQLVEAKDKSDSLNQALTNKLTRSLTREEMNDVDVQVLKGVVYISLADNMLYKSGSYEIGSRAGETLSRLQKLSWTTKTMTFWWRVIRTTCPFRRRTSATIGTCRHYAHHQWFRLCKTSMA